MDEELHAEALARGLIRYCPICDGYEVTDRKVGVIGSGAHGVAEAMFLRGYTADVTLVAPDKAHRLAAADREQLEAAGIRAVDGPARGVGVHAECIVVETADGHWTFDSIYPALGSDIHNELAEQAGVALADDTGCILVDSHQRTSVPGIYAAGDVVLGLDQISHAVGEGGVAATTIRNDLAAQRPLRRLFAPG
jgi:thioredoxin reductase (NADPH)